MRITAAGVGQNTLAVSPMLGGLFFSPNPIIGGASASGPVLLNFNAGSGGATVALRSNSSPITVPATVTVPQGASQATFTINSSNVTSATTGTITAALLGARTPSSLTLEPALSSFSVTPSAVPGGAAATLVIYLGANGWGEVV